MVTRKLDSKGKDYILVYTEEEKEAMKLKQKINNQYYFLKQTILIPIKTIDNTNYSKLYKLDSENSNEIEVKQIDKKRSCIEKYSLKNGIKNGIKDGMYCQYYIKQKDENNAEEKEEILILKANYKEGKLDGKCTIWYPFDNQDILKEFYYINGILENTV